MSLTFFFSRRSTSTCQAMMQLIMWKKEPKRKGTNRSLAVQVQSKREREKSGLLREGET